MATIKFSNLPVAFQDVAGKGKFASGKGSVVCRIPDGKVEKAESRHWNVGVDKKTGGRVLNFKFSVKPADDENPLVFDVIDTSTGEEFHLTPEALSREILLGLRLDTADITAREYLWEVGGRSGVTLYVTAATFTAHMDDSSMIEDF